MAKPQQVTCFHANLQDRPGELFGIMKDLKAKGVNLTAVWGFATSPGNGEVYAVAKNPQKLREAWKALGLAAEEKNAFFIKGTDRTGALLKTLEALSTARVNITAIEAIAVGGQFGSFIWVNDADVGRAAGVLGAK